MADLAAGNFPAIRNVLEQGDNIITLTATTVVKAGMVVAINATGVSMAVDPSIATAGSRSIGVALYDAAAGAKVAVALQGCIVYVCNAIDTAIDAGDYLETNDAACTGAVSTAAVAAITGAVGTNHLDVIGIALDVIGASSTTVGATGRMLIQPITLVQLNNA